MHPFQFTAALSFVCPDPDSSFAFDPLQNNRFHWFGKGLDKLGKYAIAETDNLYLELEWNYGREQTYLVVSTEGEGDGMTKFILKDNKTHRLYLFSR